MSALTGQDNGLVTKKAHCALRGPRCAVCELAALETVLRLDFVVV
jgi:hypothetical protein